MRPSALLPLGLLLAWAAFCLSGWGVQSGGALRQWWQIPLHWLGAVADCGLPLFLFSLCCGGGAGFPLPAFLGGWKLSPLLGGMWWSLTGVGWFLSFWVLLSPLWWCYRYPSPCFFGGRGTDAPAMGGLWGCLFLIEQGQPPLPPGLASFFLLGFFLIH